MKLVFHPGGRTVEVSKGTTLMEAARSAGLALENQCGGLGTCGNCKALILKGRAEPPTAVERETLTGRELRHGLRLACQARVLGPRAEVLLLPHSLVMEQRYQLDGAAAGFKPDPPLRARDLRVPLPSLDDARSDLERLADALRTDPGILLDHAGLEALRELPGALRESSGEVRAVLRQGRLLALRPSRSAATLYGLAIDLGTSKVALYLTDLDTGEVVQASGLMNPQLPFGEDVVSRLGYAMEGQAHGRQLRDVLLEGINAEIANLCAEAGISPRDVLEVSLVGNTAMHHLFLELPVRQLAFSPYVPAVSHALEAPAATLGLGVLEQATVFMPAPIAGYVGSDLLAAVLATRLHRRKGIRLLIDLGTNTEIALKAPDGITCCSCASGPAFEGGSLKHGMRAAAGAVEEVTIGDDGEPRFTTVGNAKPCGLCGTGALSALASMREAGVLDAGGRIPPGAPGVAEERGETIFRVARRTGRSGRPGGWVGLSQADVRELQKAKGAVRAGIEMLLDHAGLAAGDLDEIILAGAFGNYLNPTDILEIAMLPPLPLRKVTQVGNAAGVGAREMLCSLRHRREAEKLAGGMGYLELAAYPRADLFFASSMLLGEEAVQAYMRKWRKS